MPARKRRKSVGTHLLAAAGGALAVGLGMWLLGGLPTLVRGGPGLDPLAAPQKFAWTKQPPATFPIPPYARYLEGVKIVIDPGHGGRSEQANWKRGPTGLQEAEVNLRVAQFLRDFLLAVQADVRLTRDADIALDPEISKDNTKRIDLANGLGADLFLSIHHNAADTPNANYSTLFFHDAAECSPASRCAARYLLTGLNDALRLPEQLPAAVLSDRLLYKNGLLVLREARVPAVLGEASFHSNPQEEQRLRDPVYNRREAYGYFLGLARWAQAGLPRVRLVGPGNGGGRSETVIVALDDGLNGRGGWGSDSLRIATESITAKLDGANVTFTLEHSGKQLRVNLPRGRKSGRLVVDFENVFGQHVLHPGLPVELP